MTKEKYLWAILPVLLVLCLGWRNWRGGSLCGSFCQCAKSEIEQGDA